HVGMLFRKTIEAGAAQSVFAFNKKPQRHRQFAESLLVRFNSRQARHQIAFAVSRAARIKFAVQDRGCEWTNGPFTQMAHWLHVVVTIKNVTLRSAPAFTVD